MEKLQNSWFEMKTVKDKEIRKARENVRSTVSSLIEVACMNSRL